MAVTVKKIVLWRKEVENRPGILANALAPLANAATDIQVVMGYRHPGQESMGTFASAVVRLVGPFHCTGPASLGCLNSDRSGSVTGRAIDLFSGG